MNKPMQEMLDNLKAGAGAYSVLNAIDDYLNKPSDNTRRQMWNRIEALACFAGDQWNDERLSAMRNSTETVLPLFITAGKASGKLHWCRTAKMLALTQKKPADD